MKSKSFLTISLNLSMLYPTSTTLIISQFNVSPVCTKHNYLEFFTNRVVKNTITSTFGQISQSMSYTNNNTFSSSYGVSFTNALRNNLDYLANDTTWLGNNSISYLGRAAYCNSCNLLNNYSGKFVQDTKVYMKNIVSSNQYTITGFFKIGGVYKKATGTYAAALMNYTGFVTLSDYDDLFMGKNNDYFAIKNNALIYIENS